MVAFARYSVVVAGLIGTVAWAQTAPSRDQDTSQQQTSPDTTSMQPADTGESTSSSVQQTDTGRPSDSDRAALAGRGGSNPTRSNATYSETIGAEIYSPIGRPVGRTVDPK